MKEARKKEIEKLHKATITKENGWKKRRNERRKLNEKQRKR